MGILCTKANFQECFQVGFAPAAGFKEYLRKRLFQESGVQHAAVGWQVVNMWLRELSQLVSGYWCLCEGAKGREEECSFILSVV